MLRTLALTAAAALALSLVPSIAAADDVGFNGRTLAPVDDVAPTHPVPEPSAALAFALGMGVVAGARRRNRK